MVHRPIEENWRCKRSGDCCQQPVLLTRSEALELVKARPDLAEAPIFSAHSDPRFLVLGKPQTDCPFLGWELSKTGYLATCTAHAVRPYSCRRFGCYRPDPQAEPYEPEAVDGPNRRLGCANLSDRLGDRKVRKAYAIQQRKSMKWARTHDWPDETLPATSGSTIVFYGLTQKLY